MTSPDLSDLLPGEVQERFRGGSDVVLVPIGSIEQHGPHLLLGTDGYFALALARETAKLCGGVVAPQVPFCWVGATNAFPGGIGVRESVFIQYLREVVKGLWKSGARRIVVVNAHGGNYYALRSFPHDLFKEEGIPVLCTYGAAECREASEAMHEAGGEAGAVAGALRLLGREDLVEAILENARKAVAEFGDNPKVQLEPASARAARRLGVVGHDYSHECLHVQPTSGLNPDRGAEAIGLAARHLAGILDDFRDYVESLSPQTSRASLPATL